MFSDLKKGFQVHTLDTNTVPKYELGRVVAVSEPRYLPPQPGQYQTMQTRVVDLTVELTGETKTYTVPESQNVAKAMGITLSTSIDPIMNELNAIKNTSQEIIDSVHGAMSNMSLQCTIRMASRRSSNVRTSW